MQTATTQRAVKARTKAPASVYPRLPSSEHPGFWLAVFLIDSAELEALDKHRRTAAIRKAPWVLKQALWNSQRLMRENMQLSTGYVVQEGLLPFAHAHTTYFDQPVAV